MSLHRDRQMDDHEQSIFNHAYALGHRHACMRMQMWLLMKALKSKKFPGDDIQHAKGRAAAYKNAAERQALNL